MTTVIDRFRASFTGQRTEIVQGAVSEFSEAVAKAKAAGLAEPEMIAIVGYPTDTPAIVETPPAVAPAPITGAVQDDTTYRGRALRS